MENRTTDFSFFKDKIYQYNTVAQVLHESPDVEQEQDLLEEASNMESEILKSFGLPETSEFRGMLDLFCWQGDLTDKDIENLRRSLIETAENYLCSPAKSDRAFLIESKEKHLIAYDVFPIIGVETIGYNIFLYESLFYSDDYPVDVVFEEMKKGNTIPVDTLRKMNTPLLLEGKLDNEISTIGLKFWNDFINYEKTEKRNPDKDLIQLLDSARYEWQEIFPLKFFFKEGYVPSIKLIAANEPCISIKIAIGLGLGWMHIYVRMPFDEAILMLKKSSNKSVASMVRSMLFDQLKENLPSDYELQIREWHDTYLFCEGLDWTVEMLELEDENGNMIEDHNYYELISVFD